jgi:hypothetical protein
MPYPRIRTRGDYLMTTLNSDPRREKGISLKAEVVDVVAYEYRCNGVPKWVSIMIPPHESKPDWPKTYNGYTELLITWDGSGYTCQPLFSKRAKRQAENETAEKA